MTFIKVLFILSSVLTLFSVLFCITTKNIMHAGMGLLGTLLGVAGLYFTLGADFIGTVQIMVYVGGVVILMMFAVMLTGGKDFKSKAQKLLDLAPTMGNKFTFGIAGLMSLVFFSISFKLINNITKSIEAVAPTNFTSTVEEIGAKLITDHILVFEISSVLLLGALVGAAIISRPKRGDD
jgi:NADH:ubiquinone oxidoreductase subunit 6 (subunit J)